jgi:signal transduction histidine kinase
MRVERISVKEFVKECLEVKKNDAELNGIRLEDELDDPDAKISGDRRLLRDAVSNLIDMAIRSSCPGCSVSIAYHSDTARDSIVVSNDGRGIPYEELRDIRDLFCRPFAYGIDEADELPPGLLGLSVVRDVADLHGGRVGVRSLEGDGSSFSLHLPRRLASIRS